MARFLPRPIRPLLWIASSRKDYGAFPPRVQEVFGFELFLAQTGQHPPSAKMFKKKSKSGIKTPQIEIELIRRRFRDAETHHASRVAKENEK